MLKSSPLGPQDVIVFGNRVYNYRGNQVKMRSFGWTLIQYDWCPYQKRKVGHKNRHTQKKDNVHRNTWRMPYEDEGRYWNDLSTSQRLPENQQNLEEHRTNPPSQPSEGTNTANTLILDF